MNHDKETKLKAIEVLKVRAEEQREQLEAIDLRLADYYDDLIQYSNIETDSPNDHHNGYEILGAIKLLRLLRNYPFDTELVQSKIYAYEGEWRQEGRKWLHVCNGLKHPGDRGPSYYRLQPFQVFVLCAIYGPHVWINTRNEAGTRELLPTEKEHDGYIWDLRRLCTEFTLYTPRKTSKTQLSAYIQFDFFMTGDDNAECFCTANSSDQSKILFERTKALIHQLDPDEEMIRFTATQVNWKPGQFRHASLTSLSAGGKTKDGTFAQLCSADEYGSAGYVNGASDMGKLVSVIESSMAPRREPMTFISTTAGTISNGPFKEKLDAIHRNLEREINQ